MTTYSHAVRLVSSLLLSIHLIGTCAQLVEEEKMDAGECKTLGYYPDTLKCSSCHLLEKYSLEELMTDCLRCCKSREGGEHERYAYAEVEYCECNLHRFPQASAFIKSSMKDQWGSKVSLRHVRGSLPTIVLKNEEGEAQRSLNIEKWDTDTIQAFLNDWLEGDL